ncbi:MAG: hypothetical protein NW241_20385 [Bacteroidia bacterium]|nr:hypothetical protein [Bacteroidia bacterium]
MPPSLCRLPATLLLLIQMWVLRGQIPASDDVRIAAHFAAAIDLQVTDGESIHFGVASMSEYLDGKSSPYLYWSEFTVAASTPFTVVLSAADLTDGLGDTLDMRNIGFRLFDYGSHQAGVDHLLAGAAASPTGLLLLGPSVALIAPTGIGNTGTAAENRFRMHFELATPELRALSGLPTLLLQYIAPGTYYGQVLLTATAQP